MDFDFSPAQLAFRDEVEAFLDANDDPIVFDVTRENMAQVADIPERRLRLDLSVCRGLTVWCRSGVVSLTSPEGDRERWSYADLVEAAEQTVRRYEELELGLDLAAAGA